MKKIYNNKKGQFLTLMILLISIIVIAFLMVAGNMVLGNINDMVQADPNVDVQAKQVMQDQSDNQSSVWDAGALFVVVIGWLLCMGLAYNSPNSPFLLVAAIVIIIALAFVGMILSNTWNSLYTSDGISVYAQNFPMTNFILQKYLILVLVIGFSTVVAYVAGKGNG